MHYYFVLYAKATRRAKYERVRDYDHYMDALCNGIMRPYWMIKRNNVLVVAKGVGQ